MAAGAVADDAHQARDHSDEHHEMADLAVGMVHAVPVMRRPSDGGRQGEQRAHCHQAHPDLCQPGKAPEQLTGLYHEHILEILADLVAVKSFENKPP